MHSENDKKYSEAHKNYGWTSEFFGQILSFHRNKKKSEHTIHYIKLRNLYEK